jgi:GT2 family glycosyltransferase
MDPIAVVIPTQGRLTALERTLSALADQESGEVEVELVLVCSGSGRERTAEVAALASTLGLSAEVLARPDGGAAGARNAGVGAAAAELILFLNDDTPPLSRDLVRAHAEAHAARPHPRRGVLGRVVWDPEVEATPVMRWMTRTGKMNDYSGLENGAPKPTLYAPNLSLPKAALIEVGGFDERFWRYGWAEHDLALRLHDRGFAITFAPELVVGHHHRYSLRESLRRMDSVGRGANLLNRVHRARDGLGAPRPAGAKALAGRALAPVAPYVPVPPWLPERAQDHLFRVLHFAVLARGYARPPIPDGGGPKGGIPSPSEPAA